MEKYYYKIIGKKSNKVYKTGYISLDIFDMFLTVMNSNDEFNIFYLISLIVDPILEDIRKKYKKVEEEFEFVTDSADSDQGLYYRRSESDKKQI